jgi:hypothetical protein
MRTHSKLLIAGLSAALILAMSVAGASASRLSVSNKTFRVVWNPLSMSLTSGIWGPIRCPLTIEGSFHSATIRKTVGALVGYVTRGTTVAASCTGGTVTINQGALPWHVRYRTFQGTLPTFEGLQLAIVGFEFRITAGGLNCTTSTTTVEPLVTTALTNATGVVTGMRAEERFTIPLEGAFCGFGGRGAFSGTGTTTVLGATTAITVKLI